MSRILNNEEFMERLSYWAITRLEWVRRNDNYKFSEDEWEDLLGDILYKLWERIDSIREFTLDKDYPGSAVGWVNNVVHWCIGAYCNYIKRDKRILWKKELRFEDLRQMIVNRNRGISEPYVGDPLDFLASTNPEDEWLSEFVMLPKLREMLVWVGGLEFYEHYVLGEGEAPIGSHAKLVRGRMRKHWFEEVN